MPYKVKIEQFEGPLDLLLEIVEARKLSLVTIPLAEVAEQFLTHLATLTERSLEEITQFLVVGSRLALLKSRELVPSLEDTDETDGDLENLKKQLVRYHPYRSAAQKLATVAHGKERYHARPAFADTDPVFYFPQGLTLQTLAESARHVAAHALNTPVIPQATVRKTISLQVCIDHLLGVTKGENKLDFTTYVQEKPREDRVVHFIGMLELVRMGKMSARQKNNFGTIVLTAHD